MWLSGMRAMRLGVSPCRRLLSTSARASTNSYTPYLLAGTGAALGAAALAAAGVVGSGADAKAETVPADDGKVRARGEERGARRVQRARGSGLLFNSAPDVLPSCDCRSAGPGVHPLALRAHLTTPYPYPHPYFPLPRSHR
jgi:hypothetical protein